MTDIEEAALQHCGAALDDKTYVCPACGGQLDVTPLSGAVGICCEVCRFAVVCRGGKVEEL